MAPSGKNFMVIRRVVSEIFGGDGTNPPDASKLSKRDTLEIDFDTFTRCFLIVNFLNAPSLSAELVVIASTQRMPLLCYCIQSSL